MSRRISLDIWLDFLEFTAQVLRSISFVSGTKGMRRLEKT